MDRYRSRAMQLCLSEILTVGCLLSHWELDAQHSSVVCIETDVSMSY